MNKPILWKKAVVISIIILFIGVGVYPAIGIDPKQSNEIFLDKETANAKDIEPKEYLFQTIIDIIVNPEVKILFENIKNDGECISWNYNVRSVFQKLLINKPILLISLIFSKPSITQSYLNSCYNRGCEIKNILGEEKADKIIESIEIINPEFFNDLNYIIMNNEDLYNKIMTLAEINGEFNAPLSNNSIICDILVILIITYLVRYGIIGFIGKFFEGSIISKLFDLLWFKNWELAGVCAFIYDFFDCDLQ